MFSEASSSFTAEALDVEEGPGGPGAGTVKLAAPTHCAPRPVNHFVLMLFFQLGREHEQCALLTGPRWGIDVAGDRPTSRGGRLRPRGVSAGLHTGRRAAEFDEQMAVGGLGEAQVRPALWGPWARVSRRGSDTAFRPRGAMGWCCERPWSGSGFGHHPSAGVASGSFRALVSLSGTMM